LLFNHPQASLNIRFSAFLDPVAVNEGNMISAIPGINPSIVQIERPRVEISSDFLQNCFNSLTRGKQGQKIKAAQLFAGLLMESQEAANRQPPYKLVREDWMPPMLKSALVYGLTDSDWVVRVHSMAAVADLPLDYELINAISGGLNDQHWPARMMAVDLLAKKQGDSFVKVLDHVAQYDENEFVRNMAVVLGAKVPEPTQTPVEPFLKLLQEEPNSDSNRPAISPPQK
jgi:hypothetical protein